ncbi:permease [Patescibacteria group bacterium]|nr:permease [Patescibacteria group bacterium]MBU1015629.1 permease [Patescibacteria group bacterium]MBU1684994.1 permease [Patescibacteria group bacterium]MBU1938536.1 permease [Patescibacteria group bacterium]
MKHEASCDHCETPSRPIMLGKKLKIVGGFFIAIFALSYLPILQPLNESLVSYLKVIWWAILLGLLIGGLIDYFIPENFIFKYLGQRKISAIFYAVIAGFLMSACSHGILAISMQLYKKGASAPAVITFLLASPWANLPVTILLFGFFGWKALLFILAAMLIAVITGFIYMGLEKLKWIESHEVHKFDTSYKWMTFKDFNLKKAARGTLKGAVDLANMVLWWIMIGFMLAGVIGAYVPTHIFTNYFGPSFWGMILTLLFATIIEVCSEGSAPIAFEIFSKVGALGNPFVFLMAGVVTDYTEIGLIWSNIGKKTAIWLPIITVPQVLFLGYLFNLYL